MGVIIDNIELDETNIEFNYASDFVKHTDKLVYLTGKAGTGKTTFLKYLHTTTSKNTVILAPTGVAAINAGGQTIHSFFQIKPSIYIPNDKRLRKRANKDDTDKSTIYDHFKYFKERLEIISALELLIIDEISMVRCDLLDVIDRLLRVYRRRENEPFGGVQVILIGDTFQLPPIADFEQWSILKEFYDSPFFFSSKVILQNKPIYIELKKIYRQNEKEFIDLLNRVRINQVSPNELSLLNSKLNPTFSPSGNDNYIILATHNKIVDGTNLTKLAELPSELKNFEATVTGIFPDNTMPTDRVLQLKEGAQIMFIKNDKGKRYYSGKIAKIKKIDDTKIVVELSEGNEIIAKKQVWENIKYAWNEKEKKIEEEIIGTFTQFPLKLAWAITVHKSQGLTFERVIADLGAAFASGQVYVALSRCTTFSGLVLKTRIELNAIKTDPQVIQFAQNETPNTLIIQELNSGRADFYYKKVKEGLKSLDFSDAYDNLIQAIKFRNDVETDIFKRYFVNYGNKLSSFQSKYFKTLHDNRQQIADNLKLQSKIDDLDATNEENEEKISEQNRAIKLLLEKIIEHENINENQKCQISDLISANKKAEKIIENKQAKISNLTIENKVANNQIKELSEIIQEQKGTINEIEEQIQIAEHEIERLRNLKWHQRLFGQK